MQSHTVARVSQPYGQHLTPIATHATLEPLPQEAPENPNMIPVLLRRSHSSKVESITASLEVNDKAAGEHLLQIWHPSIDGLIRRTAHDYDLIMNYERDAEGGQRWLPEDIAKIRDIGKHLHSSIFALRRWQRVAATRGIQDKKTMQQIGTDANLLRLLCERVQKAINKYEQKCEFELLRDSRYAQDEDGNFYKPTTPRQYVSGSPRRIAQPSMERADDATLIRLYGHNQAASLPEKYYKDICAGSRSVRLPPGLRDCSCHPLKRNLAFDFAFQQTPFDKMRAEAVYQTVPRSDRVASGRVFKTYRDPSPGKVPLLTVFPLCFVKYEATY